MSVSYVYICDCDDCHNNSMQSDDVSFYDIDIGNETAYRELHGAGKHVCSNCFETIHHDYPQVTLDEDRELVWFDYSKL